MSLPRLPKFLVGIAHLFSCIAHMVSPVRPLAEFAANCAASAATRSYGELGMEDSCAKAQWTIC
jgi:hypothetical protein